MPPSVAAGPCAPFSTSPVNLPATISEPQVVPSPRSHPHHAASTASRRPRGVDCFEKLEQIGEGTYKSVPDLEPDPSLPRRRIWSMTPLSPRHRRPKETDTNEIVAVKKIRMDNEREGV